MKQENNEKSEDNQALINEEYDLVLNGKDATRLAKLVREFQTNPFTAKIEKIDGILEKYAHSLIINGQYLDLTFLIQRYRAIKNAEVLYKLGEFGKREDVSHLWNLTRLYIGYLGSNDKLGQRIIEATVGNTLKILAKYFVNFSVEELNKLTGITENDLLEQGVEIRNKYIHLVREEVQNDNLQGKLKEIAVVASRMSQFE